MLLRPVLAILVLTAASAALAQDIARGQEIAMQKCDTCHTLRNDKKQPVIGLFAGGKIIGGVATANLTPDPSGIPYFDDKLFLQTLRTGTVGARRLKSVMNPALFKNLGDDDLKSVFAYLRSLPAVKHRVDNAEPPTYCRLCRQKHGAGDSN